MNSSMDMEMAETSGGPTLTERIEQTRADAERTRSELLACTDGRSPSAEDVRSISCVITKLDEALMWAERIGKRW